MHVDIWPNQYNIVKLKKNKKTVVERKNKDQFYVKFLNHYV